MQRDSFQRPVSLHGTYYAGTQIEVSRLDLHNSSTENAYKSNSLCRSDFDPPHLEHTDGLLSFQFFPNTMQKVFRYDIDGGRVMSFTGRSMQIMHHHDLTVHVLHRTHPSPCTYEKQHVPMSRSRCTCELVSRPNKFWHSSNVYNNSYYYYYYYTINWAGHVAHMDIRKYKTWDIKY